MALFSKVQEMATSLVGELRLIIKPAPPKAKEPQIKQPIGKTPKFDKTVVKPNEKAQPEGKNRAAQAPPSAKTAAAPVAAETNQSAGSREVIQPLTYSGPVRIPEPLPLELLTDDEIEPNETNPGGKTAAEVAPKPAAKTGDTASLTEETVKVNKIETVTPKVETPEPKAVSAVPEANKTPVPEGEKTTFANLFGKPMEEEETPLDRLIKSLPDTTIEDVQSEAAEVQGLMNDWLQSKVQR